MTPTTKQRFITLPNSQVNNHVATTMFVPSSSAESTEPNTN